MLRETLKPLDVRGTLHIWVIVIQGRNELWNRACSNAFFREVMTLLSAAPSVFMAYIIKVQNWAHFQAQFSFYYTYIVLQNELTLKFAWLCSNLHNKSNDSGLGKSKWAHSLYDLNCSNFKVSIKPPTLVPQFYKSLYGVYFLLVFFSLSFTSTAN